MEHVADQIQSWLLQDGTSTVNASEQASAKARAHVSMTCYWRGADQDHHCEGMYGERVCGNEGKFYLEFEGQHRAGSGRHVSVSSLVFVSRGIIL